MLEARGLVAGYGRAQVLFGLDLALAAGEVVALLGRNGAGKSTTLKALIGLVPVTAGEIRFEGRRIERLAPWQRARLGLGYVPEDRRIFAELTVMENLEAGRRPPRAGAPYWTEDRLFDLFPGLGRLRHRPGASLSGGEQQMLAIARTLIGNPRAILLDEPSEGLAPAVVESLARAIAQMRREGLAVLLAEQNLRFAARTADRACVVEKGVLRYEGAMQALAADAAARARLFAV
jgi:branched-chain amino acid transport system ATP-binding protein